MQLKSANWRNNQLPSKRPLYPWSRLSLLIVALIVLFGMVQPATAEETNRKIHPNLSAEMLANPNANVRVIIQGQGTPNGDEAALSRVGGRKHRRMRNNNLVADLSARELRNLANSPSVQYIYPDVEMVSTGFVSSAGIATIYPRTVNASGLWDFGVTGQGVTVAVIDSGINPHLPDWNSDLGFNRVIDREMTLDVNPHADDLSGHGTMVAGIIGGNSCRRNDANLHCRYIGIAPEVNLIDLVTSDGSGKSYTSDVVEAIEWAIAHRDAFNIRVINLSLVSSVAESYKTSLLDAAVERAWFSGIFVVVSAGNNGPNTSLYPPANDPFVVTVGASDPMGTTSRDDDGMAPWSSYGTTQDGLTKPDVVAPGRYIPGPVASTTSKLYTAYGDRDVSPSRGRYMWMSGTSMSAPIVSGIAALAFQSNPEWTNDQLKWVLQNTSSKLVNPTTRALLKGQGAGLVDAYNTIAYPFNPGFANQGLAMSSRLTGSGIGINYNSASWSSASWSSASWSSASWSSASWSSASWSSTTGAQTTSVDLGINGYIETLPGAP